LSRCIDHYPIVSTNIPRLCGRNCVPLRLGLGSRRILRQPKRFLLALKLGLLSFDPAILGLARFPLLALDHLLLLPLRLEPSSFLCQPLALKSRRFLLLRPDSRVLSILLLFPLAELFDLPGFILLAQSLRLAILLGDTGTVSRLAHFLCCALAGELLAFGLESRLLGLEVDGGLVGSLQAH
jgi:hypothetical protein